MICKKLRKSFSLGVFTFATICLLSPFASAIKISDNFSIDGFLDMSAGAKIKDEVSATASYDQLEVDFKFDYEKLSAKADLESKGGSVDLESASISYAFNDQISLTTGRFLSCIGFEAAEPTDMFQYSHSTGIPYPGYQNGVALSISPVDMFSIYASVVSGVWDAEDTNIISEDGDLEPGFEVQLSLMPFEGFTAKVGFAGDIMGEQHEEEKGEAKAHDHDHEEETFMKSEINAWVKYVTGPITIAAEIDVLSNWDQVDEGGLHFLGMANYSITDEIGVTARFSGYQMDEDEDMTTSMTFSPSYIINDNWSALLEVKQYLTGNEEGTEIAIETIMTF